jgi:hypothetical protein
MGCTEIPLALDCRAFPFPLIDPAIAFARALIRAAGPTRLRTRQPATTLPEGQEEIQFFLSQIKTPLSA